jgi:hypothetical protein
VVVAVAPVLVPVLVSAFVSVLVFVLVSVAVLGSAAPLAEVVVGAPAAVDDSPVDVSVVVLTVRSPSVDTDTAPPTMTVSEVVSLEERLVEVEVGAVVLRKGPTCLLISLGK